MFSKTIGEKKTKTNIRAFTLIELLVVVTIIAILTSLILLAVFNARKESRDTARATVAEQISLGVRLYKEAHGTYPEYPNGVELGVGNPIDAELAPFLKSSLVDPLGDTAGNEYEYWYYPNFLCNGERRDVVIVKKMEFDDNGNFDEVCGGQASVIEKGFSFIEHVFAQGSEGNRSTGSGAGGTGKSGDTSGLIRVTNTTNQKSPVTCSITTTPTTIQKTSGGVSVNISWTPAQTGLIVVKNSLGSDVINTNSVSPITVPIASIDPKGTYSVDLTSPTDAFDACSKTFQVTAPSTQCNDGRDNDDLEDTLIDSNDPGCHSSDNLSLPYDETISSEANTVDYTETDAGYTGSGAAATESTSTNFTEAAYVVFIN